MDDDDEAVDAEPVEPDAARSPPDWRVVDDEDVRGGRRAEPPGYGPSMTRRNAAKFFAGIAGLAAVGVFAADALEGLTSMGNVAGIGHQELTYKTIFVQGSHIVDKDGKRIHVDDLPAGSGKETTVYPEKKGGGALVMLKTSVLLVRFDESSYQAPTDVQGTVQGYAAYSKWCTHEGCPVTGRSGPNDRYFHCPCHDSVYDPLHGAHVVSGPAPRPLPQLPLAITKSGHLLVAKDHFSAPLGPQGV